MRDIKKFTVVILFVSLSVIGSLLKLPTGLGSVALDSAPALVAAALFGRNNGALVAAVGHLSAAFFAGFPLGVFHLLVAIEMGLLVYGFGWLFQHHWKKAAYIFFFIGNAFLAPLPFIFFMGSAFVMALFPSLIMGTMANVLVSFAVIPSLVKLPMIDSRKMPHA
ncbi:ECF transporter S component [Thermaerobacillus caldiproteolyticus]|uniref:ECF transporter S component n=1 Tax=Thermaerobacillus caldiproteolyticus TaxID=247480 RepID=UPI00188B2773|nr:ECF transporter S component [Anoxybacillus caldiproteolyticus]QPA29884.1 ECF transporter S component [Anoxybacillus caldiproteolyticus]